jgi:hypothetical protein
VRLANSRWDVVADAPEDHSLVAAELIALEIRLDGDHATADVNAHGIGHDGVARHECGPNRWAETMVRVRH